MSESTMEIGGNDIYLEGDVSLQAPEFIRRLLAMAWPEAIVTDVNTTDVAISQAIQDPFGLWQMSSELFVYRTPATWRAVSEKDDFSDLMHVFIEPSGITLVVDKPWVKLAEEIVLALRVNQVVAVLTPAKFEAMVGKAYLSAYFTDAEFIKLGDAQLPINKVRNQHVLVFGPPPQLGYVQEILHEENGVFLRVQLLGGSMLNVEINAVHLIRNKEKKRHG